MFSIQCIESKYKTYRLINDYAMTAMAIFGLTRTLTLRGGLVTCRVLVARAPVRAVSLCLCESYVHTPLLLRSQEIDFDC